MTNPFANIVTTITTKEIKSHQRAPAKPSPYDSADAKERMARAASPIAPARDKMEWVWRKY